MSSNDARDSEDFSALDSIPAGLLSSKIDPEFPAEDSGGGGGTGDVTILSSLECGSGCPDEEVRSLVCCLLNLKGKPMAHLVLRMKSPTPAFMIV